MGKRCFGCDWGVSHHKWIPSFVRVTMEDWDGEGGLPPFGSDQEEEGGGQAPPQKIQRPRPTHVGGRGGVESPGTYPEGGGYRTISGPSKGWKILNNSFYFSCPYFYPLDPPRYPQHLVGGCQLNILFLTKNSRCFKFMWKTWFEKSL